MLVTLTLDRDRWASPEEAHEYVMSGQFIRRLMHRLGVKTWVWVLEFQGKSGTGWPHWHLLVDASHAPRRGLDLQRAWRLWREKWGLGGLDVTEKRWASPSHAVNYVTKYLVKFPGRGFPLWVLESTRRIRFFQGSRKLGPLVSPPVVKSESDESSEACAAETDEASEAPSKERRPMRALIDRMAECRTRCNAVRRTSLPNGTEQCTFLEVLDINASRLAMMAVYGDLASPVEIEKVVREYGETRVVERRPVLLSPDGSRAVKRLRDELEAKGEPAEHRNRVERARAQLLEQNEFAGREDCDAGGSIDGE